MYDASGVRLEAGKQAQILNQIVEYFTKKNIPVQITRKEALKELLGHTPCGGIWWFNSRYSRSLYSVFIIFYNGVL